MADSTDPGAPQHGGDAPERHELEDLRRFDEALVRAAPRLLVVPALVALNLLVYVAFGLAGGGWVKADTVQLIDWGSNFGPATATTERWRLLSAAFLHADIAHLLVNMMALWSFGERCERFYGAPVFAAIYLCSAVAGNAFSLWFDPAIHSVGASGAISGVLGAMLVYMLDDARSIPKLLLQDHAKSLLLLIAYAAFASPGTIDHAAHVGGLMVGGTIAIVLMRTTGTAPSARSFVASVVLGAALASGVAAAADGAYRYMTDQRLMNDIGFFESMQEPDARLVQVSDPGRLSYLLESCRRNGGKIAEHRLSGSSQLRPLQDLAVAYASFRCEAIELLTERRETPAAFQNSLELKERLARAESARSAMRAWRDERFPSLFASP